MKRRHVIVIALLVLLFAWTATAGLGPSGSWALVIGNTQYASPSIRDLGSPEADAALMAENLTSCGRFWQDQVSQLSNASFMEIIAAFHDLELQLALQRREAPELKQLVVVYYSGHGCVTGTGGAIIPSDAELDLLSATVIDELLLNLLLDRLRPADVVVILDCGQVGAEGLAAPGRLVLAASGMDECAYEDQALGHGVFTYHLVAALALSDNDGDGSVSFQEAFAYSQTMVSSYVKNNFGQEATPEMTDGIGIPAIWVPYVNRCPATTESDDGGAMTK